MITSLSAETFAAISIGLVIGLIILLILQIVTGLRVQRLTSPIYEYAKSQSQAEADRIVNEAREEARKMLAASQGDVEALVLKQRADIEARAQVYEKTLEALSMAAQQAMDKSGEKARGIQAELAQRISGEIDAQGKDLKARMERIEHDFDEFLKRNQTQVSAIQQALEDGRRTLTEGLNRTLEDMSSEGKKRIDERIDGALKDAEAEVNTYREARKRLVDEHMVDLITETSKVVLRKALTPNEHADLVERALKEARATGML